jgi:hypothetical protein
MVVIIQKKRKRTLIMDRVKYTTIPSVQTGHATAGNLFPTSRLATAGFGPHGRRSVRSRPHQGPSHAEIRKREMEAADAPGPVQRHRVRASMTATQWTLPSTLLFSSRARYSPREVGVKQWKQPWCPSEWIGLPEYKSASPRPLCIVVQRLKC